MRCAQPRLRKHAWHSLQLHHMFQSIHTVTRGEAHISATYGIHVPTPEVCHEVPVLIERHRHQRIGPAPAAQGSAVSALANRRRLHDQTAEEYVDVQA